MLKNDARNENLAMGGQNRKEKLKEDARAYMHGKVLKVSDKDA